MSTPVTLIVLTGTQDEVPAARRSVVEKAQAGGTPLDDETVDAIRLVVSELLTNAVIHGDGPVKIGLYHRPGRLVLDVHDGNPHPPLATAAGHEDEYGRGMALVGVLAARSGWEPTTCGKRVWAEIVVPDPTPTARVTVLRRFFLAQPSLRVGPSAQPFLMADAS